MNKITALPKPAICAKPQKNLPAAFRRLVWNYYVGERWGRTRCWVCREQSISVFNFEVGHVVARAKGGLDTVENTRCVCSGCNKSIGTMDMHDFREKHGLVPKWYQISWDILTGQCSW